MLNFFYEKLNLKIWNVKPVELYEFLLFADNVYRIIGQLAIIVVLKLQLQIENYISKYVNTKYRCTYC